MELARLNAKYGVNKFSFVTSGRSLSDKNIDKLCEYAVKIKQEMKINLCASMGLLTREQLKRLKDAGITRYHCNLETSRRYFSTLCTSHTTDEKIETIRHALELGMEVCSGGIIGMGETMEDRVDLALTVRELGVKSTPMNVLNPIPGTPLEGAASLADEEVLTTVAVFRFIHPDAFLRFAGGRAAFVQSGLPAENLVEYGEARFCYEEGYQAMHHVLEEHPEITAAYAIADVVAIGAMRAAQDAGRTVGKDLSLIGFDGLALGESLTPRLATIGQSVERLAREATGTLLDAIENGAPARRVTVPFTVISGESVGLGPGAQAKM